MTKMNRRDYLMGMGAAIGGFATIPQIEIFGQGLSPLEAHKGPRVLVPQATVSHAPQNWALPWEQPIPNVTDPRELVRLIFYGLNGFSSRIANGRVVCDVGFHSSGDGNHKHNLFVEAYGGSGLPRIYPTGNHVTINSIGLSVPAVDPRFTNGVYFYQPRYAQQIVTRADLTDSKDFRWILDFESDYLYRKFASGGVPRKSNIYKPVFSVPHGLFYTFHKTASTFEVKTASNQHRSLIGPVADWIVANIYVNRGTGVTLNINGTNYPIPAPAEIYFLNLCFKGNSHCDAIPTSSDRKKRGDFFLNYKAFDRGNTPELELFLVQSNPLTEVSTDLQHLQDVLRLFPEHEQQHEKSQSLFSRVVNDESPCAGAGYSGGGGIPPNSSS